MYARKLKILHAHSSSSLDRHRASALRSLSAGICKKSSFPTRGSLALVAAMNAELGTLHEEKKTFVEALPALRTCNSRSAPKKSLSMTDLQTAGRHPPI
eukprot:Gb_21153 [translate_table: standard]